MNNLIKIKNILLILTMCITFTSVNGQNIINTIETKEITNGVNTFKVNRRSLIYNENLKINQEIYYGYDEDSYMTTKIIGTIEYSESDSIEKIITYRKYPKKYIEVDFKKGFYKNYSNNTYLKFKQNFIFDGLQNGNKIVVNYKNGKREGVCLQTDSGVIYKKTVSVNVPNIKLLQFNILRFSQQLSTEDVYQLFNGFFSNFKNDLVDGNVNSFFLNGNKKLESKYSNGVISSYSSYNISNQVLNKIIKTENGLIKNKLILNGTIDSEKNNYLITNKSINNIGRIFEKQNNSLINSNYLKDQIFKEHIYSEFYENEEDKKSILDKYKILLDDPDQLLSLLKIPLFEIIRFSDDDENNLHFLKCLNKSIDSIDLMNLNKEITSFNFDYRKYKEHEILFLEKDKYESQSSIQKKLEILKSQINYTIYNSYLLKVNKLNIDTTGIENVIYFNEGVGERVNKNDFNIKITLNDDFSDKKIEIINIIKRNVDKLGTFLYGTHYIYFDGNKKYNFVYKYIEQKVKLENFWIE